MSAEGNPDQGDVVIVDRRGHTLHLTLNRPRVLNAINTAMRLRLTELLLEADRDPDVHVIVLGGSGRSFCAGNDLKESTSESVEVSGNRAEEYFTLYDTVRHLTKPIVVRIHGHCAGAGLQIALLADLRIAGTSAKIGMTELNVGMPVVIGSSLLLAVVGEAAMRRLILMADFVEGSQALALNLVHEVAPDNDLDLRIAEITASLSTRSQAAIKLTKQWWLEITAPLIDKTWKYARDNAALLAAARSADIPRKFGGPRK